MNERDDIFEAWIMVEHLSEGDFKPNNMQPLNKLEDNDFYTLFNQLRSSGKRISKNAGFVVYVDVFDFKEVVNILRKKYDLKPTEEEIRNGKKFTAAVYFDVNLNLLSNKTFCTVSGHIRKKNEMLREKDFREFENTLKSELASFFQSEPEAKFEKDRFNNAMLSLIKRFNTSLNKCYVKPLTNVDSDAEHLHSFYIADLEKAKTIISNNLEDYLCGFGGKRIDLDGKSDSVKYNLKPFKEILQPCKYPLGRFPGNTEFSLSFMQQVAVNLSIGYDNRTIRSVNGPPGTGKTTLLKDIFAELVVKQAAEIVKMAERTIKGTKETIYYDRASIGELPDNITENGIVVASSNNGAVQNIVNELPLLSGIDESLIGELRAADYFGELSNQKLLSKWVEDEVGYKKEVFFTQPNGGKDKFWGLFSLEGGRAENMKNITTSIKRIYEYLNDVGYKADSDAYRDFNKQYSNVQGMVNKAQEYALYCEKREQLDQKKTAFETERTHWKQETTAKIEELTTVTHKCTEKMRNIEKALKQNAVRRTRIQDDRHQFNACLEVMKSQKPGWLSRKSKKIEYSNHINEISKQLLNAIAEDNICLETENKLKDSYGELKRMVDDYQKKCRDIQVELKNRITHREAQLSKLEEEIADFEKRTSDIRLKPLDMTVKYDELQSSNPWFDENYRKAQSRLFIAALRVRKQFLYENQKNLNAAWNIWNRQNDHTDNKRLIVAAWHWINFAIPVISSTFASFSRMCRNLDTGTLGHLFIDEAGQALPQAAVGAVFRSRHIIAVGDPLQIKPILSLDSNILSMLAKHFKVDQKYLSSSASVQTLTDKASRFGFYYDDDKSDDSWVGIPLWVHRRCRYPMFTLSNEISYRNMMVQGKKVFGKTGWFDISGTADDKYVREQGEFLKQKIQCMAKENSKILDKNEKDVIYVISPFSNVAYQLSEILRTIGFTRYDEHHKPTNIGTIHTFQGKEAPIVFMVLGADRQSKCAADWAVDEPNMMNVAVTRASEEFYIIGDKRLYMGLRSEVIEKTIRIIDQYSKEYPELVDNNI